MRSRSFACFAALTLGGSLFVAGCGDDGDDDAIAQTCEKMEPIEGPDDVTLERLNDLLDVAPDRIEDDVRLIRDRLQAEGEAAYEDEEVGAAFERVGAFEEEEC